VALVRSDDAGWFARSAARLYLRLFGWRVEGRLPVGTKAVAIAAPHTSNWDLPFMLAVSYVLGVRPSWLGKRQLFRGAFGRLMRRLGGVPVDRHRRTNLVRQVVDYFGTVDRLFLVIPPSGTRGRAPHWKSGFYHIARGAGVPIICAFLDYRRKVGGVGPVIVPSGNVAADMQIIREFYDDVTAKYPKLTSPARLLEEDATPEPARLEA
jgi:1-acyl-sn-glycerol-3-phosphate acyltransferase